MIAVILRHANGADQEVLLAGIPRIGELIRLRNGPTSPSYVVEHVLWLEGSPEPSVVIVVRPYVEGLKG